MSSVAENVLYYGDNLDILERHIRSESVDLVYLDPPFNSSANYNVLFAERDGSRSTAQFEAFEDTWQWGDRASFTFRRMAEAGGDVALALQAFRHLLGTNDMLAYLTMMAPRLVELRRVLKPTGSIYLHCDPTASHYLKILMDAIFGPTNFQNEIVWKRTTAHSSAKRYGPVHDTLLYYSRSDTFTWNPQFAPYSEAYIESHYRSKDHDGRPYTLSDLTAAGVRHGSSGRSWRGFDVTSKGNHWKFTIERLEALDVEGLIYWPQHGGWPRYKRYLDTVKGIRLQDVWTDIEPLNSQAQERLGYPTQKPEPLLERIIQASSNEGDVVLDPFCGCGTAIAAAQKLNRCWIGIDVTQLAVTLIKSRLQYTFGQDAVKQYSVIGEPTTFTEAVKLAEDDKFQFQVWALGLVGARPHEVKKGADQGIDGRLFFHYNNDDETKQVILSVKGGRNISVKDVRELGEVVTREQAVMGVLITLHDPTGPMTDHAREAGVFRSPWGEHHRLQILTVAELLSGKRIDMPPIQQVNRTFKRAPKARATAPVAAQLPLDEMAE